MRIKSLIYADPREIGWSLDKLELKDGTNLFVGASGAGKSRVLNIIFNISAFVTRDQAANGQWTLHFEHSGVDYTWKCDVAPVGDDREGHVFSEELWIGSPDHPETSLFTRTETEFRFGPKEVPKLAKKTSAINLLRDEDSVKPVYEAFSRVMRRLFWGSDLTAAIAFQAVPHQVVRKLEKRPNLLDMFGLEVSLNVVLYLLNRYFTDEFELVCDHFKRVFPFVTELRMTTADKVVGGPFGSDVPVAMVKERGIEKPVPLQNVSSGMQKVLLIITDIVTAPLGLLYMIDEYENSLGVNAIDFLPSFLSECGGGRQYIITTHHPLLINAIPVSDWFIFHRRGLHIRITHGREIEDKYGRSKQQRFIQLINDPLYTNGVE